MYEQSSDFGVGYALGRDSNDSKNNGFGNDWSWIIALALIGGLFGGGYGFGGGFGGFGGAYGAGLGGDFIGWQLGKLASTNDVASGFSTAEIMSDLNDIILGQAQMQNFINQGFAGVNQTITNGFAGVNNAICTLGYQNQAGFNALGHQLSDCCCATQRAIDGVKYANEKQTYDIIASQNAQTQRLLDFMIGEKLSAKDAEISTLKAQISNDRQSAYIIDRLSPCPRPSYVVQPPQPVTFATNCCGGVSYAGAGYGYGTCGASVQ